MVNKKGIYCHLPYLPYLPLLTSRNKVKKLVDFFERKSLPAPPNQWLEEIQQ